MISTFYDKTKQTDYKVQKTKYVAFKPIILKDQKKEKIIHLSSEEQEYLSKIKVTDTKQVPNKIVNKWVDNTRQTKTMDLYNHM